VKPEHLWIPIRHQPKVNLLGLREKLPQKQTISEFWKSEGRLGGNEPLPEGSSSAGIIFSEYKSIFIVSDEMRKTRAGLVDEVLLIHHMLSRLD
jgi:hypothetical protein